MQETVRYSFRLRPGKLATAALESEWHRCRFLWNEAVHQQRSFQHASIGKLGKLLTAARRGNAWLRAGSQNAQQQMLRTYVQALDDSFRVRGRGRPVFKSRKKALPSLGYTTRGFNIDADRRLVLAKGIVLPVVWHRELPSEATSVRVYRDSLGHWYASFVVRRAIELAALEGSDGIGVDWGVSVTATTTDPAFDLPYLGHRRRCAAKLARAQRTLARRKKGSRRRNAAKLQVAKLSMTAARQTAYDTRAWAKHVVDAHEVIAVENFTPKFLAKSTMARKAADAAIGAAKRELVERGHRAGRKVVLVQPAHTTMTCSRCWSRTKTGIALGERTFRCADCGHTDSRDRNAARVILAVAESGHVRVDDVRQSDRPPFGAVGLVAV
ncbi:RNA-guided endonuclease InsQ/TnpB family protein [Rhodococcus erythropolis]|uniref:RNA-guided endonuclease InsQ/TnpB family protein n=1 Tax=Rhodococcus erythropolis TaxID=1833 RepID=UPI002227A676|nr:transposase [Rhodococcus erythropolis]MCW2295278.1 putative transposase [Rhodococcus erythropolis]